MSIQSFELNGLGIFLLGIALVSGCSGPEAGQRNAAETEQQAVAVSDDEHSITSIVSSEELILSLTPKLKKLNKSLANLRLPDDVSRQLFANQIEVSNRISPPQGESDIYPGIFSSKWDISSESETTSAEDLILWEPLISDIKYLNHGKFNFVRGSFADAERTKYQSLLGSSGSAVLDSGQILGWTAKVEAVWSRDPDNNQWAISKWKTKSLETTLSETPIFAEVLDDALRDKESWRLATSGLHDQMTSGLYDGRRPERVEGDKYPFFFAETTLEHTSVAVVDIDSDGFDDMFVTMRHTRNLLFRNNQDGTFEECASRYGLDQTANCSAAIFGDFDNDGDPDLFVGRPRQRGQYLVNNSGTFEDRTEELIGADLPFMISSISAADYNGDGLLDVHLSTYGPLESIHKFTANDSPIWAKQYLSEEEHAEFKKELPKTHVYLNRPGPPNMLLVNAGNGAFQVAKENDQVRLWRQSFQATWNDFDNDGDPDLYIANDYGPDNFLRNDFPNGFTDITKDSGIAIGFGMGVSWNDYNNDGLIDLYVSNMFSKAGQRITADVSEIDPRFKKLATGNYLYRGNGEKFKLVSGTSPEEMHVAKAGWAWGGQFVDFNNDGFSDIYSPNGYYTAPSDIAIDIDL
jgi:hypothetical protein